MSEPPGGMFAEAIQRTIDMFMVRRPRPVCAICGGTDWQPWELLRSTVAFGTPLDVSFEAGPILLAQSFRCVGCDHLLSVHIGTIPLDQRRLEAAQARRQ